MSTTARVHPYFPLVRVIAEATLTVFKPQVGAKVVGIVNKSTEDYIGLLVLGFINVAVARKDIREDFLAPNLESNCWRSKKNPEHSIKVSDPVVFEIISIKQDGPYLALVGALRKNSTGNQAYVASHEDKKHKNKRKLSSKEGELKPKKDSEIPDPFVDGSVKHSGRDELLSTDLGNDRMHKGQDVRQDGLSDKPAKKKKTKKSNKSSEPDVGEKMRAKKKKRT